MGSVLSRLSQRWFVPLDHKLSHDSFSKDSYFVEGKYSKTKLRVGGTAIVPTKYMFYRHADRRTLIDSHS